ncbi:hypothetical protein AAHZ94_33520, partial [Streptomyces sp. HSW2009]
MNDFVDPVPVRRPADAEPAATVHQLVFRWEGNQGRQGTGMKAVAHSCSADRAAELGQELGPLLWVSGAAASRPSVVRTVSRDGQVMLVQRWPTVDRSGRPSTISRVLLGSPAELKARQCIALAYGEGWSERATAEQAEGALPPVNCADIDRMARTRLPRMTERLEEVRTALIMVTAEWLRNPAQRVSLRADALPSDSDEDGDTAPLVYLGLFLVFGSWLGGEWTFATYDAVDSHPLRLTCVPHWEPGGGPGKLARVVAQLPRPPREEHKAAAILVNYLLANPNARPGVPPLVEGLRGGAALPWSQRYPRLRAVLTALDAPGRRPHSAAAGAASAADAASSADGALPASEQQGGQAGGAGRVGQLGLAGQQAPDPAGAAQSGGRSVRGPLVDPQGADPAVPGQATAGPPTAGQPVTGQPAPGHPTSGHPTGGPAAGQRTVEPAGPAEPVSDHPRRPATGQGQPAGQQSAGQQPAARQPTGHQPAGHQAGGVFFTSDAAAATPCVDVGGGRVIKKKRGGGG